MERTQIRCGIVIPAYVNLKLYDYAFYTTVTFHIDESIVDFLTKDSKTRTITNAKVFVFSKTNSRGKLLHYYCIRRDYNNLNLIHDACWIQANRDKIIMMRIMRKAKIDVLNKQIEQLQLF